ncbi:MCP four helix bundle domain-containing protein [Dyella sp. LX-66]|uniref:methyl-accepting chemotaxis protein n=1 Tax=unclassified Dyella TaxID=2634549 RepID=UPI001BDF90C9|nr:MULTISPECIES: methyl-accepting chemotaxis protein [unclassified Dyella]MBT2115957.1 MCP four helix bundle domain-containing protein [Dyella sp. LX-1]MBT2137967.1 MCP four helix bundle domain-containing protein [Dyella sp. LX-66]
MKIPAIKFKLPAMTVRNRLRGVLGLLGLMLIGGAAVGLGAMHLQNEGMRQMYDDEMAPTELVSRINTRSLMSFIVMGEATTLLDKPDPLKQKLGEFQKYQDEMVELKKQYAALPRSSKLVELYKKWRSTDEDYAQAKKDMIDALNQKDPAASDVLEMQVRPLMMERQAALAKLIEAQRVEAKEIYDGQVSRYQWIRAASLIALIAGLLIAIVAAVMLIRSIIGTLNRAVRIANEIAEGKLGHDIEAGRNDELGQLLEAFRTMDQRLAAIVGEVRHGSGAVSTAAQQIARGNDDLSQRTQEQASSLEETASSMEEMTSTVKQNAENASHANQLARGAREQAERGGEVVTQAVGAMREINDSSRKISDIVSLIDEIAFQTNLLALNAAVEAARAGEQGRGFAVVATEVRNLAQRSAGAAKEIKGLIADSAEKVRTGTSLVDQSGKALAEIVDSVKKVTDIVAEIAAASQEQSAGIDQVNNAVTQMDEMTQQNAALVEEAAAAARAMQEQAGELSRQVGFFRLGDEAAVAAPARKAAATASAEAEAVFAAVRSSAPVRAQRAVETADAGVWKEF